MLKIGDVTLPYPVLLAPMAGITDLPFRQVVLGFGAGLVVSEMVASDEMVQARPGTRARAALGLASGQETGQETGQKAELRSAQERTAIQLAARDPHWASEAARMVADLGAPIIDINMGCPARKVVGGLSGSALMRDLPLARKLIQAIVGAVTVPVTLKTRLGWDDTTQNAAELARIAEAEGVRMITVHGRTRCQFYQGQADHSAIRHIRQAVDIPVIANGDISTPQSARAALSKSGADGVMIGRAAGGQPWLPALIGHAVFGGTRPEIPQGAALADMVAGHYQASLSFYGRKMGHKVIRKHLGWYMDHAATPPALRREVLTAQSPEQVLALLPSALTVAPRIEAVA